MVFGVMIKCTGGQTTIHFLKSIRGGATSSSSHHTKTTFDDAFDQDS
jgi:hypothetical protein